MFISIAPKMLWNVSDDIRQVDERIDKSLHQHFCSVYANFISESNRQRYRYLDYYLASLLTVNSFSFNTHSFYKRRNCLKWLSQFRAFWLNITKSSRFAEKMAPVGYKSQLDHFAQESPLDDPTEKCAVRGSTSQKESGSHYEQRDRFSLSFD